MTIRPARAADDPELDPFLTGGEDVGRVVFVALAEGRIIGAARSVLAPPPERRSAVAVVVEDSWRERGIDGLLAARAGAELAFP